MKQKYNQKKRENNIKLETEWLKNSQKFKLIINILRMKQETQIKIQQELIEPGYIQPKQLNLDPQQSEVVKYVTRFKPSNHLQTIALRVRVYAPPGTGKTHTAVGLYKQLLTTLNKKPQHILFLSFSRKSRNDIISKIKTYITCNNFQNVNTFHLMAMRILNLDKRNILNPAKQRRYIRKIIKDNQKLILIKNIDPKKEVQTFQPQQKEELTKYTLRRVQSELNYIHSNRKSFDNYHQQLINKKLRVGKYFQNTQKIYEIILTLNKILDQQYQKNNLLTFQGLIQRAYDQLCYPDSPFKINSYIKKLKSIEYIIIDQFQDCNKIQLDMIQKILKLGVPKNLIMIGDPNQNIYEWRQALSINIDNFIQNLNNEAEGQFFKPMFLKTTYRMPQLFNNFSKSFLISNKANHYDYPQQMSCINKFQGKIQIKRYISEYTQAREICEKIKYLHDHVKINCDKKPQITYSDITILVRSFFNNDLKTKLRKYAKRLDIPMVIQIYDKDILESPSFRMVKGFVLYAAAQQKQLIQEAVQSVAMTIHQFGKSSKGLLQIFKKHGKISDKLIKQNQTKLGRVKIQDIQSMGQRLELLRQKMNDSKLTAKKLVQYIRQNFINEKYMSAAMLNKCSRRLDDVQQLADEFDVDYGPKYTNKYTYMQEFGLLDDQDDDAQKKGSKKEYVTVQTIHRAKGLQWKVVFLPGLNCFIYGQQSRLEELNLSDRHQKDRYISDLAKNEDTARRQQLRVIYTGITRPKYFLYLSCSQSNNGEILGAKKSFEFLVNISKDMLGLQQQHLEPIRPSQEDCFQQNQQRNRFNRPFQNNQRIRTRQRGR